MCLIVVLIGCDGPVINLSDPPITIQSDSGGAGREAKAGDMVTIEYRISLPSGERVLESSNYQFLLGQGAVIGGVDDTVLGMRVGGRRVVQCPPHRHWGRQGYADKVPPNTTLTLDIRLKSIQ